MADDVMGSQIANLLVLISAELGGAIALLKPEAHQQAAHARRRAYLALEAEARFGLARAASRGARGEPVPLGVYRTLLERRKMIIAGQLDELVQRIAVEGTPVDAEADG